MTFSGVFLLFTLFGDGAMFSDVDDPESLDQIGVALFDLRASDWSFIPLDGVRGASLPPVLFTVAYFLVGLLCSSFTELV